MLEFLLLAVAIAQVIDKTIDIQPGFPYEIQTDMQAFTISYDIDVTDGIGKVDAVVLPSSEVANYISGIGYRSYSCCSEFNLVSLHLDPISMTAVGTPTSVLIAARNAVDNETVLVYLAIGGPIGPGATVSPWVILVPSVAGILCCCVILATYVFVRYRKRSGYQRLDSPQP